MFEKHITDHLKAPLQVGHVKQRSQGGSNVSYIEGWHAIAEANRIFGYGNWDRELVSLTQVGGVGVDDKNRARVSYIAKVRITVHSETNGERKVVREGVGYGNGMDKMEGAAHELAAKEAETDAMKRALMTFGNPFGLALYDKTQANVASYDAARIAEFEEAIKAAPDAEVVEDVMKEYAADISRLYADNRAEWNRLSGTVRDRKLELAKAAKPKE